MIPLVFCIAAIVVVALFAYTRMRKFSACDVLNGLKAGVFRTSSTYDSPAIAALDSPRMYLQLWAGRSDGYLIIATRWPSPLSCREGTEVCRKAKREELVFEYDHSGKPLSGGKPHVLRQILRRVRSF